MIDLHAHFLPALDDGPPDWEGTLAMLREAEEDGITTAVATPHHHPGLYAPPGPLVRERLEEARGRAQEAGLAIRIEAAHEVRAQAGIARRVAEGEILPYPSSGAVRYILVELPGAELPAYLNDLLFELERAGLSPVLAHPERHAVLSRRVERVEELVERGVVMQLTADSLFGMYGERIAAASRALLEAGCVHIVASDGHAARERPMRLAEARRFAEGLIGRAASEILFSVNPKRLLQGEEIETEVRPWISRTEEPSEEKAGEGTGRGSFPFGWWRRFT